VGDPALARFDAAGDHAFPGVVTEIGADATAGTGTYAVEIRLEDPGALAAGMVGRVEIVPNASGAATVVPVEAVLEADGGRATVFTLGAGRTRVERRQVTIGFIDGDAVAVTSGLDGADAVVTEGAAWLDDGDAVRVVP
jgi:RND family efflux transporter MFP subunit